MYETEIINSRDNARLKALRAVRDGRDRSLLFVEGVRLCEELLHSELEIVNAYITEDFARDSRRSVLTNKLADRSIAVYRVSPKAYPSISDTENSQGIVITARRPVYDVSAISVDPEIGKRTVIFLTEVNNPANLGAVVRTAEAAGAAWLIVSRNSADAFSPKAIRASMGSCFRLPIAEGAAFDEIMDWAATAGLETTAADISSNHSYTDIDWSIPRLLIIGSEGHGLRPEMLERVAQLIKIPMEGGVESLNLAVSVGVLLFEARRQVLPSQSDF